MRVEVLCPAKINLFLAVGPRDDGGYHPLRTVFQAIDLCDKLAIDDSATSPSITTDWPEMPAENTLTKALRLLGECVAVPPLRIELAKRIPAQSGLGGGSSDAAGLLRGVKAILRLPISDRDLHDIACAVGADVPFFLVGGRARAEGRGEILTALDDLPTRWIVVARPRQGCPTAEAYRALDRQEYPWKDWPDGGELYNDFERVAPDPCKDLVTRMLQSGATGALLCGSGSAVFGTFGSRSLAEAAAAAIADDRTKTWLARTLSRAESLAVAKSP